MDEKERALRQKVGDAMIDNLNPLLTGPVVAMMSVALVNLPNGNQGTVWILAAEDGREDLVNDVMSQVKLGLNDQLTTAHDPVVTFRDGIKPN